MVIASLNCLACSWEDRMSLFTSKDFELENGERLPVFEIAYECYGEMAEDRGNVILVSHGITSSHHAAGAPTLDRRRGWYGELIGPGKLFDTDRYYVVSPNCLGSCYGSTGPASRNPRTGRPYRLSFPEISYTDMVGAQRSLLVSLGVEKLLAVAGSSIGGFQAFQWAVTYPDFASAIIALDTAPRDPFDTGAAVPGLLETFSRDANWNGGDYADGAMVETLTKLRIETLRLYGFEDKLEVADLAERQSILLGTAREWAMEFDANSLVALSRAIGTFNVENDLAKIKAPLLYVLCDTDKWFPASLGEDVLTKLRSAGVDARFHQVHSKLGHYATAEEPEKWVPVAREFLGAVSSR
jgi:homoserine O-acetyltransferase